MLECLHLSTVRIGPVLGRHVSLSYHFPGFGRQGQISHRLPYARLTSLLFGEVSL